MATQPRVPEKVELVVDATSNVFADLEVPNPDDALVRCDLAIYMRQVVETLRLTPEAAAARMGIEPSEAADIFNDDIDKFSRIRLIGMLKKLGYDVRVVVVHEHRSRAGARTRRAKEPSLPPRTRAARA